MNENSVAVIGAGPMGLAVAYQLTLDGYHPVVFEADDRVGGMAASFDFCGQRIERYYHFHCTSDDAFFQLLSELGLNDKLHWVETRMGYWFQGKVQPWGNPVALLRFQGLSFVAKFRYALHAFWAVQRSNGDALDHLEATSWIKAWVGNEVYEILWRKLFDYKFFKYADNLSAAWIWSRIRRIGRSRYDLFREKLGYLDGGSEALLTALHAEIINRGGEIRLNTSVTKIAVDPCHVLGIEAKGQFEQFARVVSTIPLPYIPQLIPDLPADLLDRFKALRNIAVVCVIVRLRKALTEYFWLNTNDPEMQIPGLVEYSNLYSSDGHIIYVPFYMPRSHPSFSEPDSCFLTKVKAYVKKINCDIEDQDILDMHVSRYLYAQPVCTPGYRDSLPPAALPVKGLFVADTSHYYPEDRGISESIDFGRKLARMAIR